MMFINPYLKLAFVIVLITTSYAKPFLYKPGPVLSLVVTSSSTPQQPSNIADLRVSKVEQLSKLQQDPSFFDDVQIGNATTPNEVTPGIVQKKIAKILAKLQFFSSLSSNNNHNGDSNTDEQKIPVSDNEEPPETFPITTDEFDENVLSKGNYSEEQFEKLRNFEDVTSSVPPRQLNFMPITLPRIFESIVNLAYRMLSSRTSKGRASEWPRSFTSSQTS